MKIGNRVFDTETKTYIMGILNVTPESLSDGGKFNHMDAALAHAEEMIRDGADIIDVGGESTRPGYTKISDQEEIERTVPVIEALKKNFDVPVSIDTYKSEVAKATVAAGADLVNDIWGLKYDEQMAQVIADHHVACCLMHNRKNTEYKSFMKEILNDEVWKSEVDYSSFTSLPLKNKLYIKSIQYNLYLMLFALKSMYKFKNNIKRK